MGKEPTLPPRGSLPTEDRGPWGGPTNLISGLISTLWQGKNYFYMPFPERKTTSQFRPLSKARPVPSSPLCPLVPPPPDFPISMDLPAPLGLGTGPKGAAGPWVSYSWSSRKAADLPMSQRPAWPSGDVRLACGQCSGKVACLWLGGSLHSMAWWPSSQPRAAGGGFEPQRSPRPGAEVPHLVHSQRFSNIDDGACPQPRQAAAPKGLDLWARMPAGAQALGTPWGGGDSRGVWRETSGGRPLRGSVHRRLAG